MHRVARTRRLAALAVVTFLGSTMLNQVDAQSAAPINLHKVSFANRSVPGTTCFSSKPIKLHNGHGHGGRGLVVDIGSPRFGDLNRDGHDEAFVDVSCTTGGGTAAAQVKDSWAVFTPYGRAVKLLGAFTARHQWRYVHNTLLGAPKVARGVATVTEYVYGPADADCCASLRGTTKWVVRAGHLKVVASSLGGDLLIGARSMGKATLGMTMRQLRAKYRNVHAYGASGDCSALANFGRQYDQASGSYTQMFAYFKHGRIVRIDPGSDNAVTNRGVGQYSSPGAVRRAYPHHTAAVKYQGYDFLRVRVSNSSLFLSLEKESFGTFVQYAPVLYAGYGAQPPHC